MASQKQIDANRRNALKSTGPKTARGKAALRYNNYRHGLYSALSCPERDGKELNRFMAEYGDSLKPQTPQEDRLVRDMALAAWNLEHWMQVEKEIFLDTPFSVLERISQRQSHYERTYLSSMEQLRKLRKQA